MMTDQELINAAYDLGFSAAEILDTETIPFEPAFRICCEDNSCGQYGVNYACPPACGTAEEMKQRVLSKKHGLLLQTIWEIPDLSDKALIKKCKGEHNAKIRQLVKDLPEELQGGFMIAASGCSVCPTCSMPSGEPCRFPLLKASCISAYCIYVAQLCENIGWEYDLGDGLTAFFGMYVYGDRESTGNF